VRWAAWLVRGLENYPVPSKLVGRPTPFGPAPRRFRPVFRDREELAANPNLMNEIKRVIDRSNYLIVICSPDAVRSSWVNEEVAYFRATHDDSRVFCVIVGGEPWASRRDDPGVEECFPLALRSPRPGDAADAERFQPVAADLRPGGDGRNLALLKLLSGMLGVGLDDLTNRDARRRQRQLAVVAAASFAGMVVMGGLAAVALDARNEAQRQRRQAEGLIEFMLSDLRKTLEPAGHLDALDAVGQRAMKYYSAQSPGQLDADSLGRRSRVLHLVGEVSDQKGDLGAALAVFQEAARSTGELLKRQPDNPQRIFDHAQSVYWVGYIAWQRGQVDEALRRFSEYKTLADRLVAIDPRNDAWRAEVAYANSNLGSVFLENARSEEAAKAFEINLATRLELVAHAPADRGRLADLGQSYAWYADAQLIEGDLASALASRLAERRIYVGLLSKNPSDSDVAQSLLVNREAMAKIMMQQHRLPEAIGELDLAAQSGLKLVGSDPQNTVFPSTLAAIYVTLGQAELEAGSAGAAEDAAQHALALADRLTRKDPTVFDWASRQLGGARILDMKARAQQAGTKRAWLTAVAGSPDEFRRLAALSDHAPHDQPLSRLAAEASVLAGDYWWALGDSRAADQAWTKGVQILARAGGVPRSHKYDRGRILLAQLQTRIDGRSDFQPLKTDGDSLPKYLW
jgi:tetratricopeptide (TPR) repeat protein